MLEHLVEKNGLSSRRTGKDIIHLRDELRYAHATVTYYNFMIERYLLELVDDIPIRLYRPKSNTIKAISDFVYKDCLPRHRFKSPVLQAFVSWIDHFIKYHDLD